jgi:Barstar (barnase inhibitor)
MSEEGSGEATPAALVVRIPRGVRSKEKLFSILADKLRFPRYFGWNWDALEECLRDLAWLPAHQGVVIAHDDWPFGGGGENRGIYRSVLRNVAEHWANSGDRSVIVVMPDGRASRW